MKMEINTQVKIFMSGDTGTLEEEVNIFVEDKVILDIKFTTSQCLYSGEEGTQIDYTFSAMIWFKK